MRFADWLLAAVLGLFAFAVVFAVGVVIGIDTTMSAACDGPCFDEWDEVILIALGTGLVSALGVGVGVARFLGRRRRVSRTG